MKTSFKLEIAFPNTNDRLAFEVLKKLNVTVNEEAIEVKGEESPSVHCVEDKGGGGGEQRHLHIAERINHKTMSWREI